MFPAAEACDRKRSDLGAAERPEERRTLRIIAANDDKWRRVFRATDRFLPARGPRLALKRARYRRAALEVEPDRRGSRHARQDINVKASPPRHLFDGLDARPAFRANKGVHRGLPPFHAGHPL